MYTKKDPGFLAGVFLSRSSTLILMMIDLFVFRNFTAKVFVFTPYHKFFTRSRRVISVKGKEMIVTQHFTVIQ
jgi:hypothetical protein